MLGIRFLFTGIFPKHFWRETVPRLDTLAVPFVPPCGTQNWRVFGRVFLWGPVSSGLIFLPQLVYILTDFIHLIQRGLPEDANPIPRHGQHAGVVRHHHPVSFCVCGHFLGLASLYVMPTFGKRNWVLSGVGFWWAHRAGGRLRVFIGRFVRWSQLAPLYQSEENLEQLVLNLAARTPGCFSIGFGVFLAVSLFFVYLFKKHLFTVKEGHA